jgi:triosephosphate isomerase
MKKTLIVANWKQNKTLDEAFEWLSDLSLPISEEKQIVLCPSFSLLHPLSEKINSLNLPIELGSQDFPAFEDGAHTGEESISSLQELIKYAIIGHSERKKYFKEAQEDVRKCRKNCFCL